jgi:hypothetical protein
MVLLRNCFVSFFDFSYLVGTDFLGHEFIVTIISIAIPIAIAWRRCCVFEPNQILIFIVTTATA